MATLIAAVLFTTFIVLTVFVVQRLQTKGAKRIGRIEDTLVGSYGVLSTNLIPGVIGKVEIHGTLWNAEAFESIAIGTRVMVVAQDNLTLTVTVAQ